MKISKQDALTWFRFFAELPEDEDLLPHQQEIAWAVFSQIEEAVDDRFRRLKAQIRAPLFRRVPLLPHGHGPERRAQDQQVQPAMQILL